MTTNNILQELQRENQNKIKFAVADIDGVLRGKIVHLDKFKGAVESGAGFCDVIFGWDINDASYDNADYTGWHTGYPDVPVYPDLETVRRIPWEDNTPFFLADLNEMEKVKVCPRSLLKKIRQQCYDMGYYPRFAQEFEWFTFENNANQLAENKPLRPMTPGMFGYSILRASLKSDYFHALFDWLSEFEVPLEGLHTETGPGVYEAAIQYDEILPAADKAILFKTAVKEIAYHFDLTATFMAKWNAELPGCSGHVHQSLWDKDQKQNLFFDEKDAQQLSPLAKSYLAGQLTCLPHILPMFAPNVNSFKRLTEGLWAPTTLTWGIDNRTTAIRFLNNSAKAARLEMRVAGSDTNPYLAMAASLASGLYGIRHDLSLEVAATQGNGYDDKSNGTLPKNLLEATQLMQQSEIAEELFGADFVRHFTQTRKWEWRQFAQAVTDWELKRYFELT